MSTDAPSRDVPVIDRIVTVLLLLALALYVAFGSIFGLLSSMASDGCSDDSCNIGLITTGVFTSAGAPIVVGVLALVWVIVRWVRGRLTWWVPLAAAVVGTALWFAGLGLTMAGVS